MTNYIEYYMKMKLESDRILGLYAEEVGSELKEVSEDTVDTIGMGLKRALWRTSYFFDGYRDVNDNINREDWRMILALRSIIEERNFIKQAAEIFTEQLLKEQNTEARERIYIKLLKISSEFSASRATKLAISITVAEVIYQALIKNVVIKNVAREFINGTLMVFQTYGYVERAAISANKLKRECPSFYWALYSKELEMLYFIVEPVLSRGVSLIGKKCNEDDIAHAIADIINM